MVEVELWVMVDENGEYVVCKDREGLKDKYEEDVGEFDGCAAVRSICITVKVPTPEPLQLEAEVKAEPNAAELKVA